MLLPGEDINAGQYDLCMSMLARLAPGDVDDLARMATEHGEATLLDRAGLDRIGRGSTSIGDLKVLLELVHI